MNRATLELTQKIQMHFPLDIDLDVLRAWNGCQKEFLQSCLMEVFSKMPKMKKLLELIGTIDISATLEPFIAKEKFVVNTDSDAKVKIYSLGENFENNFLGKVENPIGKSTLYYFKLLKRLVDDSIMEELGGKDKVESSLYEMYSLMEKQGHGQAGILLTNGYANIFYIRDNVGVLWAVGCGWDVDGWRVNAYSVAGPDEWGGGSQVFSRNPPVSQS
ncbi:MAG: hypothetical protein ACD_15C00208G0001 [uncultured bacterium]|nr:MAG: hypothetical protein ACD_15C00208G0001 [uncultured bacterium]